jgi:hypothetical protein
MFSAQQTNPSAGLVFLDPQQPQQQPLAAATTNATTASLTLPAEIVTDVAREIVAASGRRGSEIEGRLARRNPLDGTIIEGLSIQHWDRIYRKLEESCRSLVSAGATNGSRPDWVMVPQLDIVKVLYLQNEPNVRVLVFSDGRPTRFERKTLVKNIDVELGDRFSFSFGGGGGAATSSSFLNSNATPNGPEDGQEDIEESAEQRRKQQFVLRVSHKWEEVLEKPPLQKLQSVRIYSRRRFVFRDQFAYDLTQVRSGDTVARALDDSTPVVNEVEIELLRLQDPLGEQHLAHSLLAKLLDLVVHFS